MRVRLIALINRGERILQPPSRLGVHIALALALLGGAMAVYLIVIRWRGTPASSGAIEFAR